MSRRNIFLSYAPTDVEWLSRLKEQLRPLERAGKLSSWDNTRPLAGTEDRATLSDALAQAQVAVLLLSPAYLASDELFQQELLPLLRRSAEKGLRIELLLLRACPYRAIPDLDPARWQLINPVDREHLDGISLNSMTEAKQDELLKELGERLAEVTLSRPCPYRWPLVAGALGLLAVLAPLCARSSAKRLSDHGAWATHNAELTEGMRKLRFAALLWPFDEMTQIHLGNAYQMQGDMDKAERAYERAIELDPDSVLAYDLLAHLLRARHRGGEAMARLQAGLTALRKHGSNQLPDTQRKLQVCLLKNLAWVELDEGYYPAALAHSEEAETLAPQNYELLREIFCLRGYLFQKIDQPDKESYAWSNCIARIPENPEDIMLREWTDYAQARMSVLSRSSSSPR
jgi:tetratricopeptide (TPR) repeat protein